MHERKATGGTDAYFIPVICRQMASVCKRTMGAAKALCHLDRLLLSFYIGFSIYRVMR